jgi:hypothetical protein
MTWMFFNIAVATTSSTSDFVSIRRYFTEDSTPVSICQCIQRFVRDNKLNRFCTKVTSLSSSEKTLMMIHHYLDPDILS